MYLYLILALLLANYLLDLVCDISTFKYLAKPMPSEFSDVYDQEKYAKSQEYSRVTTKFGLWKKSFNLLVSLLFIALGGFAYLDVWVNSWQLTVPISGTVYLGSLLLAFTLLNLPFGVYFTFVIEGRFGFNKTTLATFFWDAVKGLLISLLLIGAVFGLAVWFFSTFGQWAWLYTWVVLTLVSLFLAFISPVVILPLFNKFSPLSDGELKSAIVEYMAKQKFKISGLFSIDGSKRSTKANAYFTGLGKTKRIALYDTLIEQLSVKEILAVLAHEVGHCVKGHIKKGLAFSFVSTGFMLYLFSFFVKDATLYANFAVSDTSVYVGMILFVLIFTPLSVLLDICSAYFSRKHEYEADAYSASTLGSGKPLISALKGLSSQNLSNLTPSPLRVFVSYSHPPVLQRINALKKFL